ncbi:hypothetical protein A9X05_09090 [Mycobacterium sp. E3298]|nr:hypothetical protein A9X05_09090 [Mycobacterium sp. E3298]
MYQFEKNKLYNHLGKSLVTELKSYNCFIAGGTITSLMCNREINDIDVYFRKEEDLIDFIEENYSSSSGWFVASTSKATLIRWKNSKDVQLIHFKYFNSADEIFETFDYTVCMGAFDFKDELFYFHNEFFKHNSQKILIYNENTAYPLVSMLRVQKYRDKGYYISKAELVKVMLSCIGLNITSYAELKEHIGGMYGENYDKMFKDTDEFSISQAIKNISKLSTSEDYFKAPEPQTIENVDELIDNIRKQPVKYFIFNNNTYRLFGHGGMKKVSKEPSNGIKVDHREVLFNKRLYKFVEKRGEQYFSFYDSAFEYKIGERAVPKGSSYSYGTPVLYFNELKNINESPYSTRDNRALLEVRFEVDDFADVSDDTVTLKACQVVREVPYVDYKFLLDNEGDNDPFGP